MYPYLRNYRLVPKKMRVIFYDKKKQTKLNSRIVKMKIRAQWHAAHKYETCKKKKTNLELKKKKTI